MLSTEGTNDKKWGNFLLLALFLQISAWSYEAYFNSTVINSVFFLNLNLSDSFATAFDMVSSFVLLGSFALFMVTKRASLLLIPTLYALALPICQIILHSSFAYEYALLSNGARIGLPLVLYLFYKGEQVWSIEKRFIIRFAIAMTFIGHGIEALIEHPKFIDFLIESSAIFLGYDLTEGTAIQILALIGAADIVFAISGLIKPRAWIYTWMATWGLVTAVCRLVYFQWDGVFPMLLRSAHWALPALVVWTILEKRKATQPWKVWSSVKG
ncbi:MAG: hypothetical protein ACJAT2_001700 [Bacteriovoracaceae bacterium]|jgi:hypothetical protein